MPIGDKTNAGVRPSSQRQLLRSREVASKPMEQEKPAMGDLPMTAAQALKTQRQHLVPYEQGEILD